MVLARKRKWVGEHKDKEVVTYTIGPRVVSVEEWEPEAYFAIGEEVEIPVVASIWQNRVMFRRDTTEDAF